MRFKASAKNFGKALTLLNKNPDITKVRICFNRAAKEHRLIFTRMLKDLKIETEYVSSNGKKKALKYPKKDFSGIPVSNQNVAGIDIGSKEIYVAYPDKSNDIQVEVFGTTTPELLRLVSTLQSQGITDAAMEATGVYWKPLYAVLGASSCAPFLVDAKQVKGKPGRKTDVLDCMWIQKLFSCDLLTPAYIPPKSGAVFRRYMRSREKFVKDRSKTMLRIEKVLLEMNVRLDIAVADCFGVSGLDIIRAIVAGERDPVKLAALRNVGTQQDESVFIESLDGFYQEDALCELKQQLETFDYLVSQIRQCESLIQGELSKWPTVTEKNPPKVSKDTYKGDKYKRKKPVKNEFHCDMRKMLYQKTGKDLTVIPAISEITAATVISELGGIDLSKFPTSKHFCSWLGLCPGNNVTGGKSKGGRAPKCKNRIKQALCMAAYTLTHSKSTLGALYRKLVLRLGSPKAIKALAHKLARLIYCLLTNEKQYVEMQELSEAKHLQNRERSLKKNAKEMGYKLVRLIEVKNE